MVQICGWGKNHAKVASALCNYGDKFERKGRVKQAKENARSGNDMLKRLNVAIASQSETAAALVQQSLPIAQPNPQALHAEAYVTVGDIGIGNVPESERVSALGGTRKNCKDRKKRAARTCNNCRERDKRLMALCPGRAPRGTCLFFVAGASIPCSLCERFGGPNKDTCRGYCTATRKRVCQFFHGDGSAKMLIEEE